MMAALTFVSWRWTPPKGYRSTFAPETVYALREMIRRHYPHDHRFVCVTDRTDEIPGIEAIRLWDDCSRLQSPIGHSYPSCYRRLKLFAPDAGEVFGERVVSIDLDTVIVGDITHLFNRPDDFVIWGESDFRSQRYCGSLWMLRTGSRPHVWTEFDEATSPRLAWSRGHRGSDQGWMSYMLPNEPTWTKKDGVYSYRKDIAKSGNRLPKDACLVSFHGKVDPWMDKMQRVPWVREHYPLQVAA